MARRPINLSDRRGFMTGAYLMTTLMAALLASPAVPAQAAGAPAPQAAPPEALPKAEQVMDWYVEASGGLAAYDKINNRVTKSTLEIVAAGIKITVTQYQAKPNKMYSVADSAVTGKIESGSNGEVVWELSAMAGPQLKEGKERATQLHLNTLDRLAYWRKAYKEVQVSGVEEIEGKSCYKVTAIPEEAPQQILYFDKESHRLVKATTSIESAMGTIPIEATLSEYKTVDGVSMPMKSAMKVLTQERLVTVESVQHNVELPPDRFDPPAEIKALLKKNP